MKIQLKKVLVRILLMLLQVLHRSLCFNFFHIDRNVTTNLLADTNQYDCKPDQTVFNPTPCFAGDVKVNLVVDEGETAELRCFVYNVDSSKTLVSWWKERELQEISLGLTTQNKRFYLPRRFYEDWTLIIKKVQPKDAGRYSCQINSESVLEKMFNLKVIAKPEKKAMMDRSYWLVKDEGYNSGNSEGQKPVHKQSEFKFNPHLIRSGPYIANERVQKPLNDERLQRNPIPKTTSEGFCLSYSSTYLLALHAVIVLVHFIPFQWEASLRFSLVKHFSWQGTT